MSERVTLRIGREDFDGWESVSISGGIERASSDFALSITERFPGEVNPSRIYPGDACEILIGTDRLITGYVDAVQPSYDSASHTIAASGRSKTGDLVDCSVVDRESFRNLDIEQIAERMAAPYGVIVVAEEDVGTKIPKFRVQRGEPVWDAIERAARTKGLLVTDDTQGRLVLTRAGNQVATDALVYGANILKGSANFNASERFSEYICRGQRAGTDDDFGAATVNQAQSEPDVEVTRRRVLVIDAEGRGDRDSCRARAAWEAATRAAKAAEATYTVRGWRQSDGLLWAPNQLVQTTDPLIGVDGQLLIVERTFTLDDTGGEITTLLVGPPDGYLLFTPPERKKLRRTAVFPIASGTAAQRVPVNVI